MTIVEICEDKNMYKNKINGFTLAETLITLVIIGVVAALTVPNMIARHQKEEIATRLKKFYSVINQAAIKAKADGNDWDYWLRNTTRANDLTYETSKKFIEQYVLPYVVYSKVKYEDRKSYVYLNDGSYFSVHKGDCLDFTVDVNGDKGRNQQGYDIHRFLYCSYFENNPYTPSGRIYPFMYNSWTTREQLVQKCRESGSYCAALLMKDGWIFKDDYPYKF